MLARPCSSAYSTTLDQIARIVRKYARQVGVQVGISAHSMRATFATTALENGCEHD